MKIFGTILLTVVCLSSGNAFADATLRLATPGGPTTSPIREVEITASEIDAALGTDFFSTNADALFMDLVALHAQLEGEIRSIALSQNKIKSVEMVRVETNPVSVRLMQLAGAVSLHAQGITTTLQATAKGGIPILCSSVHFTAIVQSASDGTFDLFTGLLDNIRVDNAVTVTQADCSGVFGFLGNLLAEIFVDGVDNLVQQKISSALENYAGFDSIQTIFSLEELTRDLDRALPPGEIRDRVLAVVDHFLSLASQNAGLQLDIVLDPDFYGAGNPLVSLTASQQKPTVSADNGTTFTLIAVDAPGASQYDIYAVGLLLASTSTSPITVPRQAAGSEILAVAHSGVIPGLKSFPGQALVRENFSCGVTGCILIP